MTIGIALPVRADEQVDDDQAKEELWRFCSPSPTYSGLSITGSISKKSTPSNSLENEAITFSADSANVENGTYRFKGDVIARRGNQQLSADQLDYNKDTEVAAASGNVRYEQDSQVIVGDSAEINTSNNHGSINPAKFWITDRHIRGQSDSIQLEGAAVTTLENASFTTCDEGSEDWVLRASSLRLDTKNNEGVAKHARVHFMHVPIFYFPYLSFPLEGRKTGFLVPSVGDSSQSGTEVSIPYYWNIAPHRDATLTPRILSRRGVLMEGEFRYLNPRNAGELNLEYIKDDRVYDDDRSAMSFQHQGQPATGWQTRLNYRSISDEDYLEDFSTELAKSSATHLERRASVDYRSDYLRTSILFLGYHTIDEDVPTSAKPYERLPQLQFNVRDWRGPAGLTLGMDTELVHFQREEGLTGSRLDLQPRLSWPVRGDAGFLVPKLSYRYTQYKLEKSSPAFDEEPSRSLPLFSIDSGLIFERQLTSWGSAAFQTLEPRLYYLNVPYRDQNNLVVDESGIDSVFDTSLPLFSMDQLYRQNRFIGGDRVGDANQLSATLTTRFIDDRGRELLRAGMGQIFYFQDREVTLPGGTIETDSSSDWVGEISTRWSKQFSAQAGIQWDTRSDNMERGSANLLYKKDKRRALKLAYRYEEDSLDQRDIAFIWPLARQWNLAGRWLHSIKDDMPLEILKGIEYESCCWTVRIVHRKYRVDAADEDESESIWLQLELKGLTSVGKPVNELLERDILSN